MSRRRQKLRQQAAAANMPGLFDNVPDTENDMPMPLPQEPVDPQELRFISFGSGSSGNCAYIGTCNCGLLIDGGVDNNFVMEQLAKNAIDPRSIHGIILTHDHFDHVRYAYAILRRNTHMRLFCTPKMLKGLQMRHNVSRRIADYHQPVYKEFPFKAGELTVTPFETSHDGSDNVGYAVEYNGVRFAVTTDTGLVTPRADFYMRQAHYLMLESDYDAEMLRTGPYGAHLKARIASATGHLDNADTGRYLATLPGEGPLQRVWLCHLSHINNTPEIALSTVQKFIMQAGTPLCVDAEPRPTETRLHIGVLPRNTASPLYCLRMPGRNNDTDSAPTH